MEIAHSQTRLQPGIKLVFAEAGPGPTIELGPFARIWIDGEVLRAETAEGRVLARHTNHCWTLHGREFFRVDCACPVKLHFENPGGESSPLLGPFMHFSCADGIAYGDGAIYANVDLESRRWYGHLDRRYWQHMVVTSAAAPSG